MCRSNFSFNQVLPQDASAELETGNAIVLGESVPIVGSLDRYRQFKGDLSIVRVLKNNMARISIQHHHLGSNFDHPTPAATAPAYYKL